MKNVDYLGKVGFEVSGEKEEEAAKVLEEALSAVTKRRNAYVQSSVDVIVAEIEHDFDVKIKLVM